MVGAFFLSRFVIILMLCFSGALIYPSVIREGKRYRESICGLAYYVKTIHQSKKNNPNLLFNNSSNHHPSKPWFFDFCVKKWILKGHLTASDTNIYAREIDSIATFFKHSKWFKFLLLFSFNNFFTMYRICDTAHYRENVLPSFLSNIIFVRQKD